MIQARSPSTTTAATAAPICLANGSQEGGTDGINSPSGRFGSRDVATGSFETTPPRRVGAFRLVAPTFDGRASARELCLPAVPVFVGVGIWPGGVSVCREDAGVCRDGLALAETRAASAWPAVAFGGAEEERRGPVPAAVAPACGIPAPTVRVRHGCRCQNRLPPASADAEGAAADGEPYAGVA